MTAVTDLVAGPELMAALHGAAGAYDGSLRVTARQALKPNVYRVTTEVDGAAQSFIVKGSNASLARRNMLVARRWLPAIGLSDAAARLLGSAADSRGERCWLIYEDLGETTLHAARRDGERLTTAVDLIARLHTRSAGHPVLPECRFHGADLGAAYVTANVTDALQLVERLAPPRFALSPEQAAVQERLWSWLRQLHADLPRRLALLSECGGPNVLLHGDLWTTNVFVLQGPDALQARLVDWDHAGVGSFVYDLSTFLLRFSPEQRPVLLERYRAAAAGGGWTLPGDRTLNGLFETAEFARFANRTMWPIVALLVDEADWAHAELAVVAQWLDAWRPVLPG